MRRLVRRSRRTERGASAVEFALVMPLLIVLLVAIVNFGFLFAQDLALSNAARQAARFGVVAANTCEGVATEAVNASSSLISDITAADVEVTVGTTSPGTSCAGDVEACEGATVGSNVTVVVTYEADVMIADFIPGLGASKTLTGTGVFRCEFS